MAPPPISISPPLNLVQQVEIEMQIQMQRNLLHFSFALPVSNTKCKCEYTPPNSISPSSQLGVYYKYNILFILVSTWRFKLRYKYKCKYNDKQFFLTYTQPQINLTYPIKKIQIVFLQFSTVSNKDTNTKGSSPTSISPHPNLTFPKLQPPRFLESQNRGELLQLLLKCFWQSTSYI